MPGDRFVPQRTYRCRASVAQETRRSAAGNDTRHHSIITHTVDSARNGLFLAKPIEYAFDHGEVCFLFQSLHGGLALIVLRKKTSMQRRIAPEGGPGASLGTVWNWHNKPLNLAGGRPPMKTLSAHAVWALESAKKKKWITQRQYNAWMPLALFHSPPKKSASGVQAWLRSSHAQGAAPPDPKPQTLFRALTSRRWQASPRPRQSPAPWHRDVPNREPEPCMQPSLPSLTCPTRPPKGPSPASPPGPGPRRPRGARRPTLARWAGRRRQLSALLRPAA